MFKFFKPKDSEAMRDKLVAHRSRLSEALSAVQANIEKLNSERLSLSASPLTRDDYTRTVLADIDRIADKQLDDYADHFRWCAKGDKDAKRSSSSVGVVRRVVAQRGSASLNTRRPELFGLPLKVGGAEGDAMNLITYALFRDPIKKAVTEAIQRIDPWPWPDATSLDDVAKRLEVIDAELTELRGEEAALKSEAAEFGAEQ